ncbi:MAG: DUF4404 family protein [Chitinivibrionales bacterium]|nr:DUF4404 family protein [Chitinivibrionales bacterium]MBD3358874.1 DUF4404 family protein [Chitinivibrionales bacterium]
MKTEELREHLEKLREEVDRIEREDDPAKMRVNRLISALEYQLENPSDTAHRERVLRDLPRTVERLEIEHPRLTGILRSIVVTLNQLGI